MKRLAIAFWIVVLALVLAGPLVLEAGQDPSSPEARATARELTAQLEQQPLGESAKKARKWLMVWVTKAHLFVEIRPRQNTHDLWARSFGA